MNVTEIIQVEHQLTATWSSSSDLHNNPADITSTPTTTSLLKTLKTLSIQQTTPSSKRISSTTSSSTINSTAAVTSTTHKPSTTTSTSKVASNDLLQYAATEKAQPSQRELPKVSFKPDTDSDQIDSLSKEMTSNVPLIDIKETTESVTPTSSTSKPVPSESHAAISKPNKPVIDYEKVKQLKEEKLVQDGGYPRPLPLIDPREERRGRGPIAQPLQDIRPGYKHTSTTSTTRQTTTCTTTTTTTTPTTTLTVKPTTQSSTTKATTTSTIKSTKRSTKLPRTTSTLEPTSVTTSKSTTKSAVPSTVQSHLSTSPIPLKITDKPTSTQSTTEYTNRPTTINKPDKVLSTIGTHSTVSSTKSFEVNNNKIKDLSNSFSNSDTGARHRDIKRATGDAERSDGKLNPESREPAPSGVQTIGSGKPDKDTGNDLQIGKLVDGKSAKDNVQHVNHVRSVDVNTTTKPTTVSTISTTTRTTPTTLTTTLPVSQEATLGNVTKLQPLLEVTETGTRETGNLTLNTLYVSPAHAPSNGTNTAAIVVPVIILALALIGITYYVIHRRRKSPLSRKLKDYRKRWEFFESRKQKNYDQEQAQTEAAPVYAKVVKKRGESINEESVPLVDLATTPNGQCVEHVVQVETNGTALCDVNDNVSGSGSNMVNAQKAEDHVDECVEFIENELYEAADKRYPPYVEDDLPEDDTYENPDEVAPRLVKREPKKRRPPPPIPVDPPYPPLGLPKPAATPPSVPPVPMPLSVHGDDSSSGSDFEELPEILRGAIGGADEEPGYYTAPACHDHSQTGPHWKPFHEYDPVYVPRNDPQAFEKFVDNTNYVRGRHRSDSRVTNPYEEIMFGNPGEDTLLNSLNDSFGTEHSLPNQGATEIPNSSGYSSAVPEDPFLSKLAAITQNIPWDTEPRYSGLVKGDVEDQLEDTAQSYTALNHSLDLEECKDQDTTCAADADPPVAGMQTGVPSEGNSRVDGQNKNEDSNSKEDKDDKGDASDDSKDELYESYDFKK